MNAILLLLWVSSITVNGDGVGIKRFFYREVNPRTDQESQMLLVVTLSSDNQNQVEGCEIFTDKERISEVLRSSADPKVETPSEEEMQDLVTDCEEFHRTKRDSSFPYGVLSSDDWEDYEPSTEIPVEPEEEEDDDEEDPDDEMPRPWWRKRSRPHKNKRRVNDSPTPNEETTATTLPSVLQETGSTEGYNGWPVIWIGTKWCGAGDIAKGYDDLGLHADTDKCCRAHDLCNDTMAPNEKRNNLTNKSPFTALSCECDKAFHKCLDRVGTLTANTIGNLYFNILMRRCYEKDYPETNRCKTYRSFMKITCKEYYKDTSAEPIYRWKKAERYKKIPVPLPIEIELPI